MQDELGVETGQPRGRRFAIVAALASLLVGAPMGSLAVRRWRRAVFWLATDLAWYAVLVVAIRTAHPRLALATVIALLGWRVAAGADAYRLARHATREASARLLILGWLALTAGGVLLALAARHFVVEAFKSPSASMSPTVLVGDHFFIAKRVGALRRGDVVVFRYPLDPSVQFVKRVIALPGDIVAQRGDGSLVVNGAPLARRLVSEICLDVTREIEEPCETWEETLDGRSYLVAESPARRGPELDQVRVPAATVFLVGDNRPNSSDSRIFGPVPLANVQGRALFIWWSSAPAGARWGRVGQAVR